MTTHCLASDSSTAARNVPEAEAPCGKIKAALGATTLVQISPWALVPPNDFNPPRSDGVNSTQSLVRLENAYNSGALDDVDSILILIGANDIWDGTAWSVTLANIADHVDVAKQAGIPIIMVSSELTQQGNGVALAAEAPTYDRITRLPDLKALVASASAGYSGKIGYVPMMERFLWEGVKRQNIASPTLLFKDPPDLGHPNHSASSIDGGDVMAEEVLKVYQALTAPSGCVWNSAQAGTNLTYSVDNLSLTQPANELGGTARCTVSVSSGKYAFFVETNVANTPPNAMIGFTKGPHNNITSIATTGADDFLYDSTGRLLNNASSASGKPTWNGVGNKVMALIDAATGKIWFKDKNGACLSGASDADIAAGLNPTFTGGAGPWWPMCGHLSGAEAANKVTAGFSGTMPHSLPSGFTPFA